MHCLTNRDFESVSISTNPFPATGGGRLWSFPTQGKWIMRPEDFIGLELSLVPGVERVYVERDDYGKEYRVLTVVNERDPEMRAKVYAREQAILDAYPHLDFDFHILARMNRHINDVVGGAGNLAYVKHR